MVTGFGSWLVGHLDGEGDGKMTKRADDNIRKWEQIRERKMMEAEIQKRVEEMMSSTKSKNRKILKRKKK